MRNLFGPGSGIWMDKIRIWDLGSGINIPDPKHCLYYLFFHIVSYRSLLISDPVQIRTRIKIQVCFDRKRNKITVDKKYVLCVKSATSMKDF
jgi:hypothetical protein